MERLKTKVEMGRARTAQPIIESKGSRIIIRNSRLLFNWNCSLMFVSHEKRRFKYVNKMFVKYFSKAILTVDNITSITDHKIRWQRFLAIYTAIMVSNGNYFKADILLRHSKLWVDINVFLFLIRNALEQITYIHRL